MDVWLAGLFISKIFEKSNEKKAVSTRRVLLRLLTQSPKEHKELQKIFSTFIIQELGFEPERDACFYNAFITT